MKALGDRLRLAITLGALALALGVAATPAQGATGDPLFNFSAPATVPPGTGFQGPCGLAVDVAGSLYVSDYYHDIVDVFNSSRTYQTQLTNVEPLDGPCGAAVDSTGKLYVNNYHRNVVKFMPSAFPVTTSTKYGTSTTVDSHNSTGVAVDPLTNNVFVDDSSYIAVYDSSGAELPKIGAGSLGDGRGIAFSRFPLTNGFVYVPDASDNKVKIYNSESGTLAGTIAGPGPGKQFVSLADSAAAVDSVTGDVYIAAAAGSQLSEHPESTIYVFDSSGGFKGRLKYNVVNASPVGLAVDNSAGANQGRVYVTSGNSIKATVYGYAPGSAVSVENGLPAVFSLSVASDGDGAGSIVSSAAGIDCSTACGAEMFGGEKVPLSASPDAGSSFVGWSGGGCSGTGDCVVNMSQATSISAEFAELPSSSSGDETIAAPGSSVSSPPITTAVQHRGRHHKIRHRHRAKHRHHARQHR